MDSFTLEEAQLFRLLSGLFGQDRVIPGMSLLAVCGGELRILPAPGKIAEPVRWAKGTKCLFTVVDHNDQPKMVMEFCDGFNQSVDLQQEEHARLMAPLLDQHGIKYLTISKRNLGIVLQDDPQRAFTRYLEDLLGISAFP